jgi:aminoglycoside phosphotransferase (APT) family kinase protein
VTNGDAEQRSVREAWLVPSTPRPIIDSVVRRVCGSIHRLVPLAGGGMNETYRAELTTGVDVVVRIARQTTPWFLDEAQLMAHARDAGVPTPEVLAVEHREHDGRLLSFSIQEFLPGRSLDELVGRSSASDLERLVIDAGEILARIHSLSPEPGRGNRHELRIPEEDNLSRILRIVAETLDPAAAAVVERGVDFMRHEVATRAMPRFSLAQGDLMPKNLLVDSGAISGVIDWEFAGPAPAAFDLARWEVSAGHPFDEESDLLHRGYARVTEPYAAAAGLTPAYAVDWILEMFAWQNPATPAQFRRGVDIIDKYTRPESS